MHIFGPVPPSVVGRDGLAIGRFGRFPEPPPRQLSRSPSPPPPVNNRDHIQPITNTFTPHLYVHPFKHTFIHSYTHQSQIHTPIHSPAVMVSTMHCNNQLVGRSVRLSGCLGSHGHLRNWGIEPVTVLVAR